MVSERPPQSFYDEVAPKNFTVERIRKGFRIDRPAYIDCCEILNREMVSLGLLGRTLNNRERKKRLLRTFAVLDSCRPDIFEQVPSKWKTSAQYAMARSINNTERRRASSPGARNKVAVFSEPLRQPFGTMTIHVWRKRDGDLVTCSCSVKDVLRKETRRNGDVRVEDLSFFEFSRLIARDKMIAFHDNKDTLFYSVRGNVRYPMRDERAWRTGVETMYWQTLEINIYVESNVEVEPSSPGESVAEDGPATRSERPLTSSSSEREFARSAKPLGGNSRGKRDRNINKRVLRSSTMLPIIK